MDITISKENLIYEEDFFNRLYTLVTTTTYPYSLSLEANWGTGKTFVMKLLKQELEGAGYHTIWFNPWEYENTGDIFIAFLSQLGKELRTMKYLIKDTSVFGLTILMAGISAFSKFYRAQVDFNSVKNTYDTIDKAIKGIHERYNDLHLSIKEEFIALTNEVFEKTEKPLVIFFDDLDRCLPDTTLKIIELLKNYFNVDKAKAIFIFGQNPNITRDFIKYKFPSIKDEFANSYYMKIFDYSINLPYISYNTVKFIHKHYNDVQNDIYSIINKYNTVFENNSFRVIERVLKQYNFNKTLKDYNVSDEEIVFFSYLRVFYPKTSESIRDFLGLQKHTVIHNKDVIAFVGSLWQIIDKTFAGVKRKHEIKETLIEIYEKKETIDVSVLNTLL